MHPKGCNSRLQGLHGIDIITPGTSTVDHIRDFDTDSFGRFQCVSNTASINAFYVWTVIPTHFPRLYRYVILTSLHSARRRLPTRLSRKNSSNIDNCGLAVQSECKVIENNRRKNKNDKKFQWQDMFLRYFNQNCL